METSDKPVITSAGVCRGSDRGSTPTRRGQTLAPGVAVARAYCLAQGPVPGPAEPPLPPDPPAEVRRFECAVTAAARELDARIATLAERPGQQDQDAILRAHRQMINDPALARKVAVAIRDRGLAAGAALRHVLEGYESQFARIRDDYLKGRIADLRCVVGLVLRHLQGGPGAASPFGPDEPVILVLHEVLPSHILLSQRLRLAGVLAEVGAETGHAAILARSLGIPVLAGLPGIVREVRTGDLVALDAHEGLVQIDPDETVQDAFRRHQRAEADRRVRPAGPRDAATAAADGVRVELLANVTGPEEAALAARFGADGIGLYRTEFLFLAHTAMPDEEEQLAAYRAVLEAAPGQAVTFRALDVGADKALPYLDRPDEPNPALGLRGTRLLMDNPEVAQTQFRAILRAGRHGRVSLLLPMISAIEEIRWAREALDHALRALSKRGEPFAEDLPLGVMVEVPSAVACLDDLLEEVDFVSIGTNDLIQYLMAADRTNPQVARLCDPSTPAIWRVLRRIIDACNERGRPVTVCGELAGQPRNFLPLLGLGLRRFSMSPALVPRLQELAGRSSALEARAIAERLLPMKTAGEIRDYLADEAGKLGTTRDQIS